MNFVSTLRPELLLPTSSGVRLLLEDYTGGCTSLSVACAALGSSPEAIPKVSKKPTVDWLQPIVLLRVDYAEGSPSLTQKG